MYSTAKPYMTFFFLDIFYNNSMIGNRYLFSYLLKDRMAVDLPVDLEKNYFDNKSE